MKERLHGRVELFRYSIIVPLINGTNPYSTIEEYCKKASERTYDFNGKEIKVKPRTIKSWYEKYNKGGLEGLEKHKRKDKNKLRKIKDLGVEERIIEIRKEYPRITTKGIYEKLIEEGYINRTVSIHCIFRYLRNNNLNYLIFDDDGEKSHYNSNIILNQNLHGKSEWYDSKKENYTKLLIGTDFTLLRNEFLDFQDYKKNIKNKANHILITLGGSDVKNYSLKILNILNELSFNDFEVIVLIGANNIHENELNSFINNSNLKVEILKNISNMPEIMKWADLAFSSGGTTVWELAFMGVPTIVGATSHVEEVLLTGLNEHNLFKTVGKLENLDKNELINIFDYLINNKDAREKMSIDGQKFIDGFGSKRVIDEMV